MRNATDDNPRFVAGLGNPGRRYAETRHNVGFMVVDLLARRWNAAGAKSAFDGTLYDIRVSRAGVGRRLLMLQPLTFMNRCGAAVRAMADFYKAGHQDLMIVLDEMALPPGKIRIRSQGSAGGHNGLSDVLTTMGGTDVPRLRIGIGQPPPVMDPADYVLAKFQPGEKKTIDEAVVTAAEAIEDWVFNGMDYVMEKYNRKDTAT